MNQINPSPMRLFFRENKKLVIAVFIIIAAIVAALFVLTRPEPSPPTITINNYSDFVRNLPASERTIIEAELYLIVSTNNNPMPNVKTALIRDDSYSQSFNNQIYQTAFIVDLPEIEQSYRLTSFFSRLPPEESGLRDYNIQSSCLSPADLIYPQFECFDRASFENGLNHFNPIVSYLPYETDFYSLNLCFNQDQTTETICLLLTAYTLPKFGIFLNTETEGQYRAEVNEWIKSINLDPNNYEIIVTD
jgi:hypothetical protein